MDNKKITELKNRFAKECEVVDLSKEYPGYIGDVKYGIITSLSESEFLLQYREIVEDYSPYILLDSAVGEIRKVFQKNEEKYRWRRRTGHLFPIDNDFDEHHPECCTDLNNEARETREWLETAISQLPSEQSRRIRAYFFQGSTLKQIAERERISKTAVYYSVQYGIKNLKKILDET